MNPIVRGLAQQLIHTNHQLLDTQRIDAIAARADAAAGGPWKAMLEGRDHASGSSCIVTAVAAIDLDGATDLDIESVAAARQDVPYLIAELRRMAALLGVPGKP